MDQHKIKFENMSYTLINKSLSQGQEFSLFFVLKKHWHHKL